MKKTILLIIFVFISLMFNGNIFAQQTVGKWVIPAAYEGAGNPVVIELTFHENGVITDATLSPVPPFDPEQPFHFSAGGYDQSFSTLFFVLGEYFCITGGV